MKPLLTVLSLGIFCLLVTIAYSETTFTGAISDDWAEAGNWSNGLPAPGNHATIPAGMAVFNNDTITTMWGYMTGWFIFNYGEIYNNGVINNDGAIINYADAVFVNDGTIYNDGEFDNRNDSGPIVNNGTVNNEGWIYIEEAFDNYGAMLNHGFLEHGQCASFDNYGVITNFSTFYIYGEFFNYGLLENDGTGTINTTGTINNYDAILNYGTVNNDGTIYQCVEWLFVLPEGNPYTTDNCVDFGCTDPTACNYVATATSENETCDYISCIGDTYTTCEVCYNAGFGTWCPNNDGSGLGYCVGTGCGTGDCVFNLQDNGCPVGCTDPTACNYDPAATIDNESCDYSSCIGDTYTTCEECYNAGFGAWCPVNDGSGLGYCCGSACGEDCVFNLQDNGCPVYGCTDPTAFNFDPLANTDNGTCQPVVYGCMDPAACNYDSQANVDNGGCIYPIQYYDCNGNCITDTDGDGVCDSLEIAGCTDPAACNYDTTATDDDSSCDFSCYGCTYSIAANYDSAAEIDDGSCIFYDCPECDITVDNDAVYDEAFDEGVASVICEEPEPCDITVDNDEVYDEAFNEGVASVICPEDPCDITVDNDEVYDEAFDQGVASVICPEDPCDITVDNDEVYDEAFDEGVASVICPEDPCPLDFDNDTHIGTSDLLLFLGFFGTECP